MNNLSTLTIKSCTQAALTLLLLLGSIMPASANPTVTLNKSVPETGGIRYYVSVSGWTNTDPTPLNCGGSRVNITCILSVIVTHSSGQAETHMDNPWRFARYNADQWTLGQALQHWGIFSLPAKAEIYTSPTSGPAVCIYLVTSDGLSTQRISDCTKPTPPPAECRNFGSSTIDHMSLADDKLQGAQASTQVTISCTSTAKIKVEIFPDNNRGIKLRDNDSLYSEIKVNGKDASSGTDVSVSGERAYLNITSTLKTFGKVSPGPFSGNAIIRISPY